MKPTPSSCSLKAGFTLVEMVVVVVLIGMMLFIAIPRFPGVGDENDMRAMARRIVILSQEAYSEAVTESKPWFLVIDLNKATSRLAQTRPSENDFEVFTLEDAESRPSPRFSDVIHPDGGMKRDGVISFAFWSNGGNESGTIHIENDAGDEMTVFLKPYLGMTEVREGYLREMIE